MSFTANANGPRGFTPVRAGQGAAPRMREHLIAPTPYAASLYKGQVVTVLSTGYIAALTDDAHDIAGVFAGCRYVNASGETVFSKYWPASTAIQSGSKIVANVYPADGDNEFLIHSDAALTIAQVGEFHPLTTTVGTGGSTITGLSSAQLDGSEGSATPAGLLVQIVSVSPREEGGSHAGTLAVVKFIRPNVGGKIDGATS